MLENKEDYIYDAGLLNVIILLRLHKFYQLLVLLFNILLAFSHVVHMKNFKKLIEISSRSPKKIKKYVILRKMMERRDLSKHIII
jgi:hypothetical protein